MDTSVLIDYFRGEGNEAVEKLDFILATGLPFGINSFIYQELLQGVKTAKEFEQLKEYLGTHRFYCLRDWKESFASAARIYFECRRRGITLTSTIDCLIAQTAIENNLFILHNDVDFDRMAQVVDLRFY